MVAIFCLEYHNITLYTFVVNYIIHKLQIISDIKASCVTLYIRIRWHSCSLFFCGLSYMYNVETACIIHHPLRSGAPSRRLILSSPAVSHVRPKSFLSKGYVWKDPQKQKIKIPCRRTIIRGTVTLLSDYG